MALERLIRTERLRRDIAACRRVPATDEELGLAILSAGSDIADDTDWEAP